MRQNKVIFVETEYNNEAKNNEQSQIARVILTTIVMEWILSHLVAELIAVKVTISNWSTDKACSTWYSSSISPRY